MNKEKGKAKIENIIFLIILIIIFICFYPLIIVADGEDEHHCKSLIGLRVNCG